MRRPRGPVGILEVGGGWDVATSTLLPVRSRDFTGLTTPLAADPPNLAPADDHATLVSEVVGAPHATYLGVAPGASQYIAYFDTTASFRSAIDWYTRTYGVGIYNMSFGGNALSSTANAPQNQNNAGTFTLTAAGSSRDIVLDGSRFNFGAPLAHSMHNITVGIQVNDGDSGVGDFDRNNLFLAITNGSTDGAPLLVNAVFNGLRNGQTDTSFATAELTPADQATLLAKFNAAPANQLTAQIVRAVNVAGDGGVGTGNTMTFTNVNAVMTISQRNNAGLSQDSLSLDWYARQKDVLFVKSAGNVGDESRQITDPGDFFNGITVGASDGDFEARASFSSYWLNGDNGTAADVRKPDILAPGTEIEGRFQDSSDGTSFAAPFVTGTAALVVQRAGMTLADGAGHDHLGVKAIILNSARKRFINVPQNQYPLAFDNSGSAAEASDKDYLDGNQFRAAGPGPTTAQWTPSTWTYAAGGNGFFNTTNPLDDEQGTGMLDAGRAMVQTDGGKQGPGNVTPIGWDINTVGAASSVFYALDFPIAAGTFLTATLLWDRLVDETSGVDPRAGELDAVDLFGNPVLRDLDLFVRYKTELIAASRASLDNVEHLHIPLPAYGDPGDYEIMIRQFTGSSVEYGLAWWTVAVPEPSTYGLAIVALLGMIGIVVRQRAARTKACQ